MEPPSLTGAQQAKLTIVSDCLAQSGVALLSHLLTLPTKGRHKIVYCLEHDPDMLLSGNSSDYEVVDCWSCTAFHQAESISGSQKHQLRAEMLTGAETDCNRADVFLDSLDALVSATSETRALMILRYFLTRGAHLTMLIHGDSTCPPLFAHDASISTSFLHLEVHPYSIIRHIRETYGVLLSSARSCALLRQHHLKSWAGAAYVYGDDGQNRSIEANTAWDGLGDTKQGSAFIRWSRRVTNSRKIEWGACTLRQVESRLNWERHGEGTSFESLQPASDISHDLDRPDKQLDAKKKVRLPFLRDSGGPAVVYEADSGDDLDEDEPDDELVI